MKILNRWLVILGILCTTGLASAQTSDNSSSGAALSPNDPVKSALKESRKLMPNDILAIQVVGETDLTVIRRVGNDGTITYPFLETIKVEGRTPAQIEVVIREGLTNGYLVNPQVMVDVKDYVKQFFTVLGQVNRPGQQEYPVDRKIDVLEAIGMAGDFARLAKKSKIEILRGAQKFVFSEDQLKEQVDPEKKFYVQPNDKISVGERII